MCVVEDKAEHTDDISAHVIVLQVDWCMQPAQVGVRSLVLLRFSKSCKRSVSASFMKIICGFRFGFCSWWRHCKLMYTPAIQHFSPVQTQCNYRPTCRAFDNNAEAIIISDGHLKGVDISASRPQQDAVTPFNMALFDLHLDHSTTTSSLRWHMACV